MKQLCNEREKFMPKLGHECRNLVSPQVRTRTLRIGAELRIRLRVCKRGEEGGALVEMALVLPILMLVLTGIFSFGIAMANYMQLTEAVDVGGRLLAISRNQYLDPCAAAVTAIESAAPSLAPANMTFTFVLNGTTYSGTSCSSSSYTSGAAGAITTAGTAIPNGTAQVTVTYPCNLAVYGRNLVPSCHLTAQTTELVQ